MAASMCIKHMAQHSLSFPKYIKSIPNLPAFCTIQCRNYAGRGLRRKPVRVIIPGSDGNDGQRVATARGTRFSETSHFNNNATVDPNTTKRQDIQTRDEELMYSELSTIAAKEPKIKYDKVGPDDKRVRRVLTMVKSRKYREQSKKILLEGRRLITDAILAGGQCHTIYFSRLENLEGIPWQDTGAQLLKIPFREVKLWSDVITPQGILAVFSMPTFEYFLYESTEGAIPLTVICDNIREPGNLGALLRSAVAAGCKKILVTKGCVDIWDLKVLRAGAGAHFRAPIIHNIHWEDIKNHLDDDTTVHLAECKNSETEENITMDTESESKKTAFQNRMLREPNKLLNLLAKEEYQDDDDDGDAVEQTLAEIPMTEFYNVNWSSNSAVVIGGETHGLSHQAVKLSDDTDGCKVYIPMTRGMDSLNAAMAASIIVFEAKRQCLKLLQTKD